MKTSILAALVLLVCSCRKLELIPTEPSNSQSAPPDTVVLLQTTSNIGNGQYGIADSIYLQFNQPVLVNYIRTNNNSSINYVYADGKRTVSFSYPHASLGNSYTVEYSVSSKTGTTLQQTLIVNFFNKRIQIPGFISNVFLDDESGLYWVATKNPYKLLCFSLPDFNCVKNFDIPYGSGKFFLNPYNGCMYILSNDRSTPSNGSNVYVFNPHDGRLLKTIGFTPDGYDHPQYPEIYPYDIGFTSTGYGIVLLCDEFFSGLRWKVIDSKNNDSVYIDTAWGSRYDQFPCFQKIYSNFDRSKLLMMEEYGSCAIDVLDGSSHKLERRVPSSTTRGVFLTPNRKDNRIYCGQLYDQFILDMNGELSQISYIDNRSDGTADFSYRSGEQDFIYFIDDNYFSVIDYDNATVPMWCNVVSGLTNAITTLDGLNIIAYRFDDPNSEIIVFTAEDFYKYYAYQPSQNISQQRTGNIFSASRNTSLYRRLSRGSR